MKNESFVIVPKELSVLVREGGNNCRCGQPSGLFSNSGAKCRTITANGPESTKICMRGLIDKSDTNEEEKSKGTFEVVGRFGRPHKDTTMMASPPRTTRLMQPTHTPQQEEGSQFCVYDGGPTLVDPKDPQQNRKEKGRRTILEFIGLIEERYFTWSGLCVNKWKRRTLEIRSRPIFRVGKDFFAMRKSSKRKKKKKNVMIVKIRSEVLHFRPPTFSLTFA
ncbi:hypothetical protein OUZ56_019887 [Daphnia magna]|uniref:Uncharacterized protein n=1 Tax=Daphnia magna TaxID=35525 RepID=A0ABQ9ZCX4_9CRUS|nr:hypothetical protein OUZ56_019887 [Daphnia magna]